MEMRRGVDGAMGNLGRALQLVTAANTDAAVSGVRTPIRSSS